MIPNYMDIKYENNIKEENEYFAFRSEFQALYQNIFTIKSMSVIVIGSINKRFEVIKNNLTKCNNNELELPLFFMNLLHVSRKDPSETELFKIPFYKSLEIPFTNVSSEIVLLQYHEFLSRYLNFYMTDKTAVKLVIDIYLSDKGIKYPNIKLGSKFCSMFVKFLEKNKQNLEFIAFDTALNIKNVLDSLVNSKNFTYVVEYSSLYQALGLLIMQKYFEDTWKEQALVVIFLMLMLFRESSNQSSIYSLYTDSSTKNSNTSAK